MTFHFGNPPRVAALCRHGDGRCGRGRGRAAAGPRQPPGPVRLGSRLVSERPSRKPVRRPRGATAPRLSSRRSMSARRPRPTIRSGSAAPRSRPNTSTRRARPPRWSRNSATWCSATRSTRWSVISSSGSCLAVTPVAEELKALTVYFDCGTPRIFEETARKYVFRASPHATMDNVGAARYLLAKHKDVALYSGINQNYAWGQDSWRDFVGAMKVLAPKAAVDKELFPKLFAGEYGAENLDPADVEIAGPAYQFLGRRPRRLRLSGAGARPR